MNNSAKILGGLTALYSGYSAIKTLNHVRVSNLPRQTLQRNIAPLIHTALGCTLGGLGVVLGDNSLSVAGALQIASQQLSGKYFSYQNREDDKKRSELAKRLSSDLFTQGCCAYINAEAENLTEAQRANIIKKLSDSRLQAYIHDIKDKNNKHNLEKKAKGIFKKLDTSSMKGLNDYENNSQLNDDEKEFYKTILKKFPNETLKFKMTDEERKLFKKYAAAQFIYSDNPISYSGTILDIFELKDGVVPSKDLTFPDKNIKETENQYGRFLDNNAEFIIADSTNHDGQNQNIKLKTGDYIHANLRITGNKKYLIRVQPDDKNTNEAVYENKVMTALEQFNNKNKFEWDLSTGLAVASLSALFGTIMIGTPIIQQIEKISLLESLAKSTKLGANIAHILMPCAINASDMRGNLASKIDEKKKIIVKNDKLFQKLADMNINPKNQNYHFLIDFNGTLTKGSEFKNLYSVQREISNENMMNIFDKIVALGDVADNSHHIHIALKEKFHDLQDNKHNKTRTTLNKNDVKTIEGQGVFHIKDTETYGIGNEVLIETMINKIAETKNNDSAKEYYKNEMHQKLKSLKDRHTQELTTSVTYIMFNDDLYALETKPKLRDDAKSFLNEHKGRFTVLTGAKLPSDIKNALELDEKNCQEEQKPEDKKKYAEELIINNKKIPKEKIVAFGDGGNDWGMFHNVNIATQLGEMNDNKSMNFADAFSDVVIQELSDFKILNLVAQEGIKSHNRLKIFGMTEIALMAGLSLLNRHTHNHLLHIGFHLGSQIALDLYARYRSEEVIKNVLNSVKN